MSNIYWIFESIRVVFAFLFILFVWPTIVFRKHLKAKSRTYRFAFCAVVMPVLVNTGVLGLGLLHILDTRIVKLLFWGILLISILKDAVISERNRKRFKNLFSGTYGYKSMLSDIGSWIKKTIGKIGKSFFSFMKGHWFEYSLLFILVVFGVIYFSIAVFEDHSYGFGDMYPHHAWTYNLTKGTIFYDGVYPEGMHCFVYCESVLFGIKIYNCLLFTAGIQSAVILISMFILFREMFEWKYAPYLLLALFLTVDLKNGYAVTCQSRWQWTMPQEFGFPAMFLCATYMIRYLRENSVTELMQKRKLERAIKKEKQKPAETERTFFGFFSGIKAKISKMRKPLFWEEDNLRIFTLGLATTIICHFYTTILAFFLCLCIVVCMLGRLFSKRFLPIVVAALSALVIAFLPMAGAFAEGIPPQGSLTWALEIAGILEEEEGFAGTGSFVETDNIQNDNADVAEPVPVDGTESVTVTEKHTVTFAEIVEAVKNKCNILYNAGFVDLFGEERAALFLTAGAFSAFLWLAIKICSFIKYRIKKKEPQKKKSRHIAYLSFVLMLFLYTAVFCEAPLGLPSIIEWYRACIFAQFAGLGLLVVPIDFIASLLINDDESVYVRITVAAGVIGIYTLTRILGVFHGYLMFELTRYNSAVTVTNSIMEDMGEDDNFIIISTTDEYYQQIEHGYHEEIINFVNESQNKGYTLPAKYIYIYVEKNTIERAQYHVFTGPSWLADKKYGLFYAGSSQCPMINKEVINEEMSQVFFGKFPLHSSVYNTLWQRVILMSKLYVWCQKFNAMYPNELHTYYEDDDFVCYYIVQNPRNLYELAVFDPTVMIPPQEYPNPIWPQDAFKDVSVAAG